MEHLPPDAHAFLVDVPPKGNVAVGKLVSGRNSYPVVLHKPMVFQGKAWYTPAFWLIDRFPAPGTPAAPALNIQMVIDLAVPEPSGQYVAIHCQDPEKAREAKRQTDDVNMCLQYLEEVRRLVLPHATVMLGACENGEWSAANIPFYVKSFVRSTASCPKAIHMAVDITANKPGTPALTGPWEPDYNTSSVTLFDEDGYVIMIKGRAARMHEVLNARSKVKWGMTFAYLGKSQGKLTMKVKLHELKVKTPTAPICNMLMDPEEIREREERKRKREQRDPDLSDTEAAEQGEAEEEEDVVKGTPDFPAAEDDVDDTVFPEEPAGGFVEEPVPEPPKKRSKKEKA